ncbi:MAG: type II secretion system F family protein, partial [Chloroflexota bacterium]
MAVYTYKAWSSTAAPARGTITADTPAAAREQLRHAGLRVVDLRPLRESMIRPRWSALSRRREDAVTEIYNELATLLGAGIVLLEAIETVAAQQSSKAVRQCLHLLRDRITAGSTLADAMRQQPPWFDALSAAVVEVGERTGQLDQVLEQLAEFRRRASDWRGRVVIAFIYPSIVVIAGMAVTVFLMT